MRIMRATVAVIILAVLAWGGIELERRLDGRWQAPGDWWGAHATESHYGEEVREWSAFYDLPFPYLMALIQLESGGKKPAGKRFEKHVFKKLQELQEEQRMTFENLTPSHLDGASQEAIRNLATSWGPFQLMGYKCILLGVQIRDIRGQDAIRSGVDWINQTYGDRLRKGQYRDAFHLHNTGKPYPKEGPPSTYHADYVERGLRFMEEYTDAESFRNSTDAL